MKPVNFQSFLFPINGILTAVVFFLLSPAVRIYARWFPDKKDALWFFPLGVVLGSAVLWLSASMATPYLIKRGIFENRRRDSRPEDSEAAKRFWKMIFPILIFVFHMLVLIGICISVLVGMRNNSSDDNIRDILWNYVQR